MTTTLDKADACASSLTGAYRSLGEFAMVIRTTPDCKGFRLIAPQTDVPQLSEWLRLIADRLFDGPEQGVQKQ